MCSSSRSSCCSRPGAGVESRHTQGCHSGEWSSSSMQHRPAAFCAVPHLPWQSGIWSKHPRVGALLPLARPPVAGSAVVAVRLISRAHIREVDPGDAGRKRTQRLFIVCKAKLNATRVCAPFPHVPLCPTSCTWSGCVCRALRAKQVPRHRARGSPRPQDAGPGQALPCPVSKTFLNHHTLHAREKQMWGQQAAWAGCVSCCRGRA